MLRGKVGLKDLPGLRFAAACFRRVVGERESDRDQAGERFESEMTMVTFSWGGVGDVPEYVE